jgi:hypothetical protein
MISVTDASLKGVPELRSFYSRYISLALAMSNAAAAVISKWESLFEMNRAEDGWMRSWNL